jgi:hypothetical protein
MIQAINEQQVLQEGFQILLTHLEPSKLARFWAACNFGSGDYLKLKDQLFAEETVASLYAKILDFQSSQSKVESP